MHNTFKAAALAGVTVRQLRHWVARGYLRPAIVVGDGGQGSKSFSWADSEVDKAAMLGALSQAVADVLPVFAMHLACGIDYPDACGVLYAEGAYEVLVEVRRVSKAEANGKH